MRTTIVIDSAVGSRLRLEAKRRRTTMSRIVEEARRRYLDAPALPRALPLPAFDGGRHLVDVNDRDALERAMDVDATTLPRRPR